MKIYSVNILPYFKKRKEYKNTEEGKKEEEEI